MGDEQPLSARPGIRSIDGRTVRRAQMATTLGVALTLALAYALSPGFRAEMARAWGLLAGGGYLRGFGVWAPVASLAMMVAQALAAPFPHFLVVFASGLAFGVWWGWGLSMLGQVLAAGVCFWIARAVGRGTVEALVGRLGLEAADRWFARRGTAGVLVTRLVRGVGFDGVSYAAGLTGIGFGPFVLATVVGSAPQTLLYVYLGRYAPGSAWVLLAATGVVVAGGFILGWARRRRLVGERSAPGGAASELPTGPNATPDAGTTTGWSN